MRQPQCWESETLQIHFENLQSSVQYLERGRDSDRFSLSLPSSRCYEPHSFCLGTCVLLHRVNPPLIWSLLSSRCNGQARAAGMKQWCKGVTKARFYMIALWTGNDSREILQKDLEQIVCFGTAGSGVKATWASLGFTPCQESVFFTPLRPPILCHSSHHFVHPTPPFCSPSP